MTITGQTRLQCDTDSQCDLVELLPFVTFNTQPMTKEKSEQKSDEAYNYAISIDEVNESLQRHGV